ncbi:PilZ domain-containing protein [Vibrio neptunius]|uniref:PilZ domain-containing protein n=1 Tax=Vibrio neptunius TaxID=170651 RepID=A0ABS3A298_9VIBR|nr:PilZ domain-containing protein [Vibrio neptunius]MBN3492544.1 PilZ domain-containing protein [Vibrio neptunius]MBN3515041.1 PilZ domain-containing protein [Vibrio neptunius]MBN3548699.1 PilZ domain-containing protein [Vibrio neptunius]MBN3577169.1 PilZ domain-containing protein [Vibrio neptunius]MCH9870834.1 PilZ domain-containing protein [Vibrio neptunius]
MTQATQSEKAEVVELSSADATQTKEVPKLPSDNIKYGEDAFIDVKPLSEVAFLITTPTGKNLKGKTKYIGLHSNNLMLLEMPKVSPKEVAVFFQRGYAIKACVIAEAGEGARIYFKSKLEYVIEAGGNSLFLITLPAATQVAAGLRESARLELALEGILAPQSHHFKCQIRDISSNGCLIVVDRNLTNHKVGDLISLSIQETESDKVVEPQVLEATVRNVKITSRYCKFGVQFEKSSLDPVASLIEGLNFCQLSQKFTL